MTTLSAITGGASQTPPSVSGLSYTAFESNSSGTIEVIASADDGDFAAGGSGNPAGTVVMVAAWDLDNTPSDFTTMDDLSFRVRYALDATDGDITMSAIRARLVSSDGNTLLAGGSNVATTNAASFQTFVAGTITTTSFVTSTLTAFSYVNTSADKTAWDGAILEINYTRARSKGGGTNVMQFSAAEVSGNYTASAAAYTLDATTPGAYALTGAATTNLLKGWLLQADPTLLEAIDRANMTGATVVLDAADSVSMPDSGGLWVDRSGNGYDWEMGWSTSPNPAAPTFNGVVGGRSGNEFLSYADAAQYHEYSASPTIETFMDDMHKAGAAHTIAFAVYLEDTNTQSFCGTVVGNNTTGFRVSTTSSGQLAIFVGNSSGTAWAFSRLSTATLNANAWNYIVVSIDEAGGANASAVNINGTEETFDAAYTSPDTGSAYGPMNIAATQPAAQKLLDGSRMGWFAFWERATTSTERAALRTEIMGRYDDGGAGYALAGVDAALVLGSVIAADPGAYALTGATANLLKAWSIDADPPLIDKINRSGLSTNLQVALDAGDGNSYSGGTSWLDTSGNNQDFWLGSSGGADGADPTFNGTQDGRSLREYFEGDSGGDFLTYDGANETWMDAMHKAGAAFAVAAWMYIPSSAAGTVIGIIGDVTGGASNIGMNLFIDAEGELHFNLFNGTGTIGLNKQETGFTVPTDQWTFVALSVDEAGGTVSFFYADGVEGTLQDFAYTTPSAAAATYALGIGQRGNGNAPLLEGCRIREIGIWNRYLSVAEMDALYAETSPLYSGGGPAYAWTGVDAALTYGKSVVADPGSYGWTGADATMVYGRAVAADPASYALTGADASLLAGRRVAADAGAYAMTGADASLLRGKTLPVDPGAYTVNGQDASLLRAWRVAADAGAYAWTGAAAGTLHGRRVVADSGGYSLDGADASLLHGKAVTAAAGAYTWTGQDAALSKSAALAMMAGTGGYAVTGAAAGILHGRALVADAGAYAWTGSPATLTKGGTGPGGVPYTIGRRRRR